MILVFAESWDNGYLSPFYKDEDDEDSDQKQWEFQRFAKIILIGSWRMSFNGLIIIPIEDREDEAFLIHIFQYIYSDLYMGGFLKSFFCRKTHGCWVPPF